MSEVTKALSSIQVNLKAPKSQFNKFGKYNYRSCEDIIEAVKKLLLIHCCSIEISDEIVLIGERYYVKATARLTHNDGEYTTTTAYAREPLNKKGMDESQITGAASSYARKYALNGLFAIDDTKDADTSDNRQNNQEVKSNNSYITNTQREGLGTHASMHKWEPESCRDYMVSRFGIDDSRKLNQEQYKQMWADIEKD